MSQYIYLLIAYVLLLCTSKLARHFYLKHKLKKKAVVLRPTLKSNLGFWDQLVFHIHSFSKNFIKFP